MSDIKRVIGMPWYDRKDYPGIRDLMTDRHNLASTYDEWLVSAENNESVGRQAGLEVVRVLIEPSSFTRWCMMHGLETDSAARMRYVMEQGMQTHANSYPG